ncbi:MAG: hypothetical protein AAF901_09575, partial [Bacteroidota bacterium]
PTKICYKELRNHRAKFFPTNSGFIIGIETKNEIPLIPLDDTKFSFIIRSKNEFINNISNVSIDRMINSNFYFTNFKNLTPQNGDTKSLNIQGRYISQSDRRFISQLLNYKFSSPTTNAVFKFFDASSSILVQEEFTPIGVAFDYYTIDTSKFKVGEYDLKVLNNTGSEISTHTLYINPIYTDISTWGLIEITNSSISGYEILDGNNVINELPTFDVKIESRKTKRKYYRHPYDIERKPSLNIPDVNGDDTPDFDSDQVDNDTAKIYFQSLNAIPLKANGNYEQFNTINLPFPTNFNIKVNEDGEFISEIYLPKLNL